MCLATRGSHIVSSSGSWLKAKRVSWHTFGEIKVILYKVDVACEGQGHAGSTPATSTIFITYRARLSRWSYSKYPACDQG